MFKKTIETTYDLKVIGKFKLETFLFLSFSTLYYSFFGELIPSSFLN